MILIKSLKVYISVSLLITGFQVPTATQFKYLGFVFLPFLKNNTDESLLVAASKNAQKILIRTAVKLYKTIFQTNARDGSNSNYCEVRLVEVELPTGYCI